MSEETGSSNENTELKAIIEAALFAADGPFRVRELNKLFPVDAQPETEAVEQALQSLVDDYAERAVELTKVGKAYRFQTKERYAPWLRNMQDARPPRFSRAFLETLAIIAYRQPVTRGDIEDIRGVSLSSDTMRSLFERGWVKEVGHRDVPGRPALLATTRKFLEYFGLQSLKELPPLQELRSMQDIAKEMNLELPLERTDEIESSEEEEGVHSAEIIPLDVVGGKDVDGDREAS